MTTEVDRLSVVWDADISKLNQKLDQIVTRSRNTAHQVEAHWSHINPGRALESVFSRSRLALFEEGGARIGVAAGALEHLGAAGLGVGAVLAGVAVVGERVKKAMEFSEDVLKASRAFGLTTDAIQEFDYIAGQIDVPVEAMRSTLGGLEQTIGDVVTGFAKARQVKVFTDGLKITPDQLRGWGDLEHQLPHILDSLAKLDAESRAGIIKRLGADPAVINSLIDARDRIADLTAEAHKNGIVVAHDIIERYAEAGDKIKQASEIIDKNLTSAFADLAPPIANATLLLAQFLHLLSQVPTEHPKLANFAAGGLLPIIGPAALLLSRDTNPAFGEQAAAGAAGSLERPPKPTQLTSGAGGAHHVTDNTDALTKTADEDLQAAIKALAEAYKALTEDIDAQAAFEVQANNADAAARQLKLKADLDKLLKDKTIDGAVSDQLQAEIELAQAKTEEARTAKETLILREAELKSARQVLDQQDRVGGYYDEIARINADLAATAKERQRIERTALDAEQRRERARAEEELRAATDAGDTGAISRAKENLAGIQDRQTAQNRQFNQDHLTPLQAYFDSLQKQTGDLNTAFSTMAAQGLQDFNTGLTDAILNGKSLGDVMHNVLQRIAADLLNLAIQKYLELPLARALNLLPSAGGNGEISGILPHLGGAGASAAAGGAGNFISSIFKGIGHIFGFASGTDSSPEGVFHLNELGKEGVAYLPKGTQVIPNDVMRGLARLNVGALKSAPSVVYHTSQLVFPQAVVTQDLLDYADRQAQAHAQRAAQTAGAAAYQASKRDFPGWVSSHDALGTSG